MATKAARVEIKNGLFYYGMRGQRVNVAKILGQEYLGDGRVQLWLDRLIHRVSDTDIGGWAPAGAITTILTGPTELLTSNLD